MNAIDLTTYSMDELNALTAKAMERLDEMKVDAAKNVRINQRVRFIGKDDKNTGTVVLIDQKGVQCSVDGINRKRRLHWNEIELL